MVDLRDLICNAQRLQAKGYARRAAAAWRIVANHEDTTDEDRDAYWKRIDKERERRAVDVDPAKCSQPKNTERDAKILAMLKAGVKRADVAKHFGVSVFVTYRIASASVIGIDERL